MVRTRKASAQFYYTVVLALLSVGIVVSIIIFPEQSFHASLQSLTVWWTIVFPALLPFFIIAEVMLAYGTLHFCGGLLNPLMRQVFKLPGTSGPTMAISLLIGYPIGARLTKRLHESDSLSAAESELLLSISHIASPLLIINVIAVGFFHHAPYGVILYAIQVISIVMVGLIMRRSLPKLRWEREEHLIANALRLMRNARLEDGRTFGKLLGDAVSSSIQMLLMIGGYMMIFAVLIQVLISTQFTALLNYVWQWFMTATMSEAFIKGWFEIHLGSYALSVMNGHHLLWIMTALSALLAWSGLSLHAQVSHLIAGTRLRYSYFLKVRVLHAFIASILTISFWTPLSRWIDAAMPSFMPTGDREGYIFNPINFIDYYVTIPLLILLLVLCMVSISCFIWVVRKRPVR